MGNMLGDSWQPLESHNLLLFHRKADCVFLGSVPPAALNHSLFVPTPFLFLDVSPVLQTAVRARLRAALSLPLASKAPGLWDLSSASALHTSAPLSGPGPAKTLLLPFCRTPG